SQYNPLFSTCDPQFTRRVEPSRDFYDHTLVPMGEPTLPSLQPEVTIDALNRRRTLLRQLDAQASRFDSAHNMNRMVERQRQALDLLLSASARSAFDLSKEPARARDRYGRDLFGSSVLLSRRLVEAGVTFVTVHTESKGNGHWDTHENNFNML